MSTFGHRGTGMFFGGHTGLKNTIDRWSFGCWRTGGGYFGCLGMALALSGGAASAVSIGTITVEPGEPGERPEVSAAVKPNLDKIRSVVLQTSQNGGAFTDVAPMTKSNGKFRAKLNPVTPGTFKAKVLVKYVPLLQSSERKTSAVKEFTIAPFSAGTFDFGAVGLSGWTFQGVFGTSTTFTPCAASELAASPHFSRYIKGWPGDADNGSLRIQVSSLCYPDARSETTSDFWRVNLASPLLTTNPQWQGAGGVSFRMISRMPLKVSAFVVVEGENGVDTLVFPTTTTQASDLTDVGPESGITWTTVTRTGYIPARPIKQVLISIFGRPEDVSNLSEPAIVQLDVVSPVTP